MTKRRICAVFAFAIIGVSLAGCARPPTSGRPASVIVNSTGMTFRLVPGGAFEMGSMTGQPDERPVHRVILSPFYISMYEVTQREYRELTGENPSQFKGPTLPVESVTWSEADSFCRRLSGQGGIVYRLPTEAEWEYAARGGMTGQAFIWGDDPRPEVNGIKHANVADESFRAAHEEAAREAGFLPGYDDQFATTSPVGSFAPNGYGLYDMIGNVFEWCLDRYVLGTQYYRESPVENPQGPGVGDDRVLRGASWWAAPARHYRVSSRFRDDPGTRAAAIGFRCVGELAPRTEPIRRTP